MIWIGEQRARGGWGRGGGHADGYLDWGAKGGGEARHADGYFTCLKPKQLSLENALLTVD